MDEDSYSSDSTTDSEHTPGGIPRLRLTFTGSNATLTLAEANRHLSLCHPQEALKLYTKILTCIAPGHPIAFLNRSLCYLVLGFPQLAAIDGRRAILAADAVGYMPKDHVNGRAMLHNYGLYTEAADLKVDIWLTEPGCYVGQKSLRFLDVRPATIFISARPRRIREKRNILRGLTNQEKAVEYMLYDIKVKATYRVALSLWKCGEGAWQSAMEQIFKAKEYSFRSSRDAQALMDLHNEILLDIERVWDEEMKIRNGLKQKGWTADDLENHEQTGFRSLLDTRLSRVERKLFPWDECSPTWENEVDKILGLLNKDTTEVTNGVCQSQLKMDEFPDMVISLIARRKITTNQTIFRERYPFNAITPEKPSYKYCAACFSSIHLAPGAYEKALKATEEYVAHRSCLSNRSSSPSSSSESSIDIDRQEKGKDVGDSPNGTDLERTHLDHQRVDSFVEPNSCEQNAGLQLCPWCKAVFCSLECADKCSYHRLFCGEHIPEFAYNITIPNQWSLPPPAATGLLNQLMKKVLAAIVTNSQSHGHPLDTIWLRQLHRNIGMPIKLPDDGSQTGADFIERWNAHGSISLPSPYLTSQPLDQALDDMRNVHTSAALRTPKTSPWSYGTNVLWPLDILFHIGAKESKLEGFKNALDCRRLDGWVLETIRYKVESAMRVTKFPRMKKGFNEEGEIIATSFEEQEAVKGDNIGEGDGAYMASFHPRTNLIREAEKSEKANVKLLDRDGHIVVVATRAVEEGEELLR
ncbi:hypothetical protein CC78DRAFT_157162 [Lojkania enalia]|uniref:Uncharacterized protein n=1 Tax=Lojkania enalia TaxID=147567 RepID=A0A9P4N505_9PLEO|nr:hypothetical protein CC78DRAFT_157162 [Didymosphaeria enalia]